MATTLATDMAGDGKELEFSGGICDLKIDIHSFQVYSRHSFPLQVTMGMHCAAAAPEHTHYACKVSLHLWDSPENRWRAHFVSVTSQLLEFFPEPSKYCSRLARVVVLWDTVRILLLFFWLFTMDESHT